MAADTRTANTWKKLPAANKDGLLPIVDGLLRNRHVSPDVGARTRNNTQSRHNDARQCAMRITTNCRLGAVPDGGVNGWRGRREGRRLASAWKL